MKGLRKSIRGRRFEIQFGLDTNLIMLKICDHCELVRYVKDLGFTKSAINLVNSKEKCPVCGKGVE